MTNHYVIIDTHTGYIWGDCHAESAHIACGIVDSEIDPGAEYQYTETNPSDATAIYAVYILNSAQFDLLQEGYDGQDGDIIESVERRGKLDGYYAREVIEA